MKYEISMSSLQFFTNLWQSCKQTCVNIDVFLRKELNIIAVLYEDIYGYMHETMKKYTVFFDR